LPAHKYSLCWLYWYKSTNSDEQGEDEAAAEANEEEEIAYESLLCASTGLENEDDGVQRHLQYSLCCCFTAALLLLYCCIRTCCLENEDTGVQRHLQYSIYLLYWSIECSVYLLY
jgi:hypothetical protein